MFAKLTFWLCLATTACSTAATHIDQGVSFQLSEGTLEARSHFMQGLVALHSFWYDEATREFDAAIAADPTMNMAYWGAAFVPVHGEDYAAAISDGVLRPRSAA